MTYYRVDITETVTEYGTYSQSVDKYYSPIIQANSEDEARELAISELEEGNLVCVDSNYGDMDTGDVNDCETQDSDITDVEVIDEPSELEITWAITGDSEDNVIDDTPSEYAIFTNKMKGLK